MRRDYTVPNPVASLPFSRWRSGTGGVALGAVAVAIAFLVCQWLLSPQSASAAPLAEAPEVGAHFVSVVDPTVVDSTDGDNTIEVGETVTLRFRMYGRSGDAVHGGITVSFPGLTDADDSSSSYSSVQGEVSTNAYTGLSGNYTSNVTYYHEDDQVNQATGDTKIRPGHLIVESYYNYWPTNVDRTLTLEVTPLEAGDFPIRYRYWLCDSDWDCARRPRGSDVDGTDQQGWNVAVYTLNVEAPELDRVRRDSPPESIELGKSIDLEFAMHMDEGPENGHGGMSISFPDLTDSSRSSSFYDSDQGKVETVSYTNGNSKVVYRHSGSDQLINNADRSQRRAEYLLVESDDESWPPDEDRTLKLKVTPGEPGEFTIYYRYWLCDKYYRNCDRDPTSSGYDRDQQNWRVREYTVTVTKPISVTVTSDPPGRTFTVEGTDYTTRYEATWESGAGLDLNAPSPQRVLGTGSRYMFSHWSPGGSSAQLTVTPTEDTTYTVHFVKQHFLATGPGQRVSGGGWYDEGEEVAVGPANPPEGQFFSHWEKNRLRIPGPAGANQDGVTVTVDDPLSVFAVYTDAPPETGANVPPSVEPVPRLASLSLNTGESWTFVAEATDSDGTVETYEWQVDGQTKRGPNDVLTSPATDSLPHTFESEGVYKITAVFTDDARESGSFTWTVQVNDEEDGPDTVDTQTQEIASEGNPWDDGTELLHELDVSSWALGPVNLPDTKVFVGRKLPSAGQSASILKVRLERNTTIEIANLLGDQLEMELANLLGISREELRELTVYALGLAIGERGKAILEELGYDLPELPNLSASVDLESIGVPSEAVDFVRSGAVTLVANSIMPGLGPLLMDVSPEALPVLYRNISRQLLERAFETALRQFLLPPELRETVDATDAVAEVAGIVAKWMVEHEGTVTTEAQNTLDSALSELEQFGIERNLVIDLADVFVTATTVAPMSAVIPGFGSIASLLIIDASLGFDGEGKVAIAVPRSAWIEYSDKERRVKRWWRSDYVEFTDEDEHGNVYFSSVAEFAVDSFVGIGLDGIGVVPIVGDAAGLVIGLALDTVEFYSDLSYLLNEELTGPRDNWLMPQSYNCTNRITVPWDIGYENVRGIEITVPIHLSDDDYVAIYSDFTRLSTGNLLLHINWPFIRQSGEVEIRDVLKTGENSPTCDRSQYTVAKPEELPGITLTPSALAVTEGSSGSYTVALNAEPDANVTIAITGQADTDLSLSDDTLTFTPDNWAPQTVTVTAAQDDGAVPDAPVTLVHTPSGGNYASAGPENVIVLIEEDEAAQLEPSGPRWRSDFPVVTSFPAGGGRVTVRALTQKTDTAPSISISGPELSRTRTASRCSLDTRPPGYTAGTGCWEATITFPVNDSGSSRSYTVTARSNEIDEDLTVELTVAPAPEQPAVVETPAAASVAEPVATGLAPLGGNLQWVLHFDNASQEWLHYDPDGSPSTGSLTQLVPGEAYWVGVEEDQTVVLGGATRTLRAGLNQIVW